MYCAIMFRRLSLFTTARVGWKISLSRDKLTYVSAINKHIIYNFVNNVRNRFIIMVYYLSKNVSVVI